MRIGAVRVADVINSTVAEFVVAQVDSANRAGRNAFLLELDTPGGLDSAMRSIIQALLGSDIPTIVYVYPDGARAASAGALITLAADFAAMAPGTNIGAAHPVAIGIGGEQNEIMLSKVTEDAVAYARSIAQQRGRNAELAELMVRDSLSLAAEDAVRRQVVDLLATDEASLLKTIDGAEYRREDKTLILHSADAELIFVEMNWRQKILNVISQPNIAYMLLMLGMLGIFFEISQPGVILPGAIGAIALLLAFFAFQTLPVNYVGVLFIILALVLFILEVKVVSYGMLTIGGIVSMTLGSLMLIEQPEPFLRISWMVIAGTVTVVSGLFMVVLFCVVRTQRRRFFSGAEGMVGEQGEAVTDIHQDGKVFVHGEYWQAYSTAPVARGEKIEVVCVGSNMRLEVKKATST
ncbi:NfeD family protein [Syntrophotalea acetylenivorans]|uniref:NfeD family protein n=1 Tax=Syntrophotalea acetylenivorans TaxID=1842532 RepID=UPI001F395459|nr:nodulation protein NfeD [Syntrophotalea acetylenivorans]